jgi:hypothetical protein
MYPGCERFAAEFKEDLTHGIEIIPSNRKGMKLTKFILLLWQYSQKRNQATLRGVENSDFNFKIAGSDVYLCLSPEQMSHKIFKRQCKALCYKECALP